MKAPAATGKQPQVVVSLPDELLERIDARRDEVQRERPGLFVSRASIVRELVLVGLQHTPTPGTGPTST
jgi:Arc/MetJ-type ribon-helix-helix transcriptional regulator